MCLSVCLSHLLQTGGIHDLLVVSERQMVKGISRIVALTGRAATQVGHAHCNAPLQCPRMLSDQCETEM